MKFEANFYVCTIFARMLHNIHCKLDGSLLEVYLRSSLRMLTNFPCLPYVCSTYFMVYVL